MSRTRTASASPPRATTARVLSVEFLNDHRDASNRKLLQRAVQNNFVQEGVTNSRAVARRRFTSTLSERGATTMAKPDWVRNGSTYRNDPILATMGESLRVELAVHFAQVPGGSASLTRIYSRAASVVALTFDVALNQPVSSGNTVAIRPLLPAAINALVSQGPISSIVGKLERTVSWFADFNRDPTEVFLGQTGPHVIYLTLGTPTGQAHYEVLANSGFDSFAERGPTQVVTDARMEHAVAGAQGATSASQVTERMFAYFMRLNMNYALHFRWVPSENLTGIQPWPALHEYLWLCAGRNEGNGECQVIAASFRLLCRLLGVMDPMEVGFMVPQPGRREAPGFPRRSDGVKGRLTVGSRNAAAVAVRGSVVRPLAFFDGSGNPNRFEGVIAVGSKLFAIGDSIFDRFSTAQNGVSAADRNSTDYFATRIPPSLPAVRSSIGNAQLGGFDLAYVDANGNPVQNQYPWDQLGKPEKDVNGPWRWED